MDPSNVPAKRANRPSPPNVDGEKPKARKKWTPSPVLEASLPAGTHAARKKQAGGGSAAKQQTTGVDTPSSSSFDAYQCPLCIEMFSELEWRFFPCPCNYRLCSWCLHQIRTLGDSKCPQCRGVYDEAKFRVLEPHCCPPFRPPVSGHDEAAVSTAASSATPTASLAIKRPVSGSAPKKLDGSATTGSSSLAASSSKPPSRVAQIVRHVAELEQRMQRGVSASPSQPPTAGVASVSPTSVRRRPAPSKSGLGVWD